MNKIELSSIEVTAYWWIHVIRSKVRELSVSRKKDELETKFLEKFYTYTEKDWRNLYLKLIDDITEDVNNFVPRGDIIGIDAFSQDTDKKGHDRLNAELSKIMQCSIPDIRLAEKYRKDSVIYTNMFGACVWYKSAGVTDLPTEYESNYILSGDEEELHFYHTLLATIAVLKRLDNRFESIPELREFFCEEYKQIYPSREDLNQLKERFHHAYEIANERGIVYGSCWEESYGSNFQDIDFIGLEQYMKMVEHYNIAQNILRKSEAKKEKNIQKESIRRKKK